MNDLVKDTLSGGITAVASITGDPVMSVAASIVAPVASSVAVDFANRSLSNWQSHRFLRGCQLIAHKIGLNIQAGKKLRIDGNMSAIDGNQAQQVLEGILQNIADEFERKKIEAHASLFTNLCFDQRIIFEQALYLARILKQLSYRQLVLIAISRDGSLQAGGWQVKFKDSMNQRLKNYADLHGEIQNLEQMKIIENSDQGFSLGGSTAPFRLSLFGNIIFEEMDLESIPEEDKDLVRRSILEVNQI